MDKISINHIKGIYKYNNNNLHNGIDFLNYHIMMYNLDEMITRDLKFSVKNYDMCLCFLMNNARKLFVHHKSNKKCFSRRKQFAKEEI